MLEDLPVTYREGSQDDIPEISTLYVESVRRSFACVYPDEYLEGLSAERREKVARERFSDPNYRLFVAETATNKLVGFADRGTPVIEGANHRRQIFSIYLLPEYQRLGIGKGLFNECVTSIVSEGNNGLCLDTVEESPYRKFYDKLGGSIVGRGQHSFGDVEMATVIYGWDDLGGV